MFAFCLFLLWIGTFGNKTLLGGEKKKFSSMMLIVGPETIYLINLVLFAPSYNIGNKLIIFHNSP